LRQNVLLITTKIVMFSLTLWACYTLLHLRICFNSRRPVLYSTRGHDTTKAVKRISQHYSTPQQ